MKNLALVISLTFIIIPATVWSHDDAHGVVKERMDLMAVAHYLLTPDRND